MTAAAAKKKRDRTAYMVEYMRERRRRRAWLPAERNPVGGGAKAHYRPEDWERRGDYVQLDKTGRATMMWPERSTEHPETLAETLRRVR